MTFNAAEVCEITGASYRQINHWTSSGYLYGERKGEGSGHVHMYSDEELRVAGWITRLVAAGLTAKAATDAARQMVDSGTHSFQLDGLWFDLDIPGA